VTTAKVITQRKIFFFSIEDAIISIVHNVLKKECDFLLCPKVRKAFSSAWPALGLRVFFFPSLKHIHNHKLNVKSSGENELTTHFNGSGDSFVPERLSCIRDRELLKNCLKDGGTSFPFLKNKTQESYHQQLYLGLGTPLPD